MSTKSSILDRYAQNKAKGVVKTQNNRSSILERYAKKKENELYLSSGNAVKEVTSRINTWLNNSGNFINNYNRRTSQAKIDTYDSSSQAWFDTITAQKNNFDLEADNIRSILGTYGKYFNEEWVNEINKALDERGKTHNDIIKGAEGQNNYWKQFSSAEEYEMLYDNHTYGTKYEGKTYADIQKALESTTGRENKWLTNNADSFMGSADAQAEIDELNAEIKKLNNEETEIAWGYNPKGKKLEDIQAERNSLQSRISTLKGIRDTKKSTEEFSKFLTAFLPSALYPELETPDFEEYVKAGEEKGSYLITLRTNKGEYGAAAAQGIQGRGVPKELKYATHLKDDEYKNYVYLLGKYGKKTAKKYLDHMELVIDKRSTDKMKTDIQKTISETSGFEGFLVNTFYSIASIPANIIGGVASFVDNTVHQIKGERINPYSEAQYSRNFANTVRSEVGNEIADTVTWELFGQNVMQNVYNAGMSAADSLVGAYTMGNLYTVVAGSGAAANQAAELYERGASNDQIFWGSIAAGTTELLTEKFSIDNLLKMKNPANKAQIVKEIFKQAGIEASEEFASEIINTLADSVIMANNSELSNLIETYENGYYDENGNYHQGISHEEAVKKAYSGKVSEIFWSAAQGFLSGGMSGGLSTTVQAAHNVKVGKNIKKLGDVDSLLNAGLASKEGSEARKIAEMIQTRVNKGKAPTSMSLGALKSTTLSNIAERANAPALTQNDIEQTLREFGASEAEIPELSRIINKAQSKSLTDKEINTIKSSEAASSVMSLVALENNIARSEATKTYDEVSAYGEENKQIQQDAFNKKTSRTMTVSSDGVTRLTETGEGVEIADVASVDGKGDVYVKLTNGKTVNTRDISFSNDNEAALYEQIGVYINDKDASVGLHPSAAKEIIGLYDSSFGVSPEEFLNAAAIAYKYGKYTLPKREISNRLPNEVSDRIYELGQVFTENKVKQSEERIKKQIEYSFKEYSSHQLENWKDSKTIIPYKNQKQLSEFIDKALSDNNYNKKIYFGQINDDLALRIKTEFGLSVEDYNCVLRADEVRKILRNSHGDQISEGLRGQRQIKKEDIMDIPLILQNPDSIELSPKQFEGKPVLVFRKELHGKETVVAYVSKKHMDLTVQTMFSGKEKSHSTTPIGNNTLSHTSETLSVKAFSNNMVSQNEPSVNSNDMQDSAKNTRKEGKLLSETTGESFETDEASLNDDQKAGLYTAKILSKALGINVYVYESYLNAEGKRVYLNADGKEVLARKGFYDAATGAIHIDLNAGKDTLNGKTVVLYTLSHELVHFIRQWSPSKFKVLADFLVSKYGEQGISVDALIHNQIKNAKEDGRTITYDTAYEEVIADSMQTMLSSGNVVESLVELKKTDRTLWGKIKSFIFDMLGRLKKALGIYKNLSPDTIEGNLVAKMKDSISELERLFTEGLADASENFKKTDVSKFETSEGVKYSVAGKHSETADFSALSVAMKMLAKDPRADTVSKTGWWKGKDGRWRYEISDKYMDLKHGAEHSVRRLSDYVKHDRLFEAYPQLEYVKLEFADKKVMNNYGSYNANTNTIKIRNDLKGKDLRQTLIHEMQHAVQYIERFASGTNVDEAAAWIFVYTYDIIKSNPEFKKLQTKEARQLYIVKEAEKLFNRKFKSIAYQLYENEHGEKEAIQAEQRMEYDDTYLKHNPVSNDGIIFDSTDQLQKEFVDTMVKIGYTQSEAIKITEGDVLHELIFHQRRDADKRSNAIPYRRNARYGSNRSTVRIDGSSGEGRIGENGNVSGKSDMEAAYSESNRESSEIRYLQSEEFSLEKGLFRESKEVGSRTTETFPPVGHSILKYSSASTDLSPRNLLSNALESEAKTDAEREKLAKYKAKISELEALEGKLEDINRQIREISFSKGQRDMNKLRLLQDEKIKTMNRIDIADKQLLRLETAKALQDIVERQIKLKLNDMKTEMKEQYRQADERREKTLRRNQIRKTVDDLNRLLIRPTKEKHVPIWLQKPVAEFLSAIEQDNDSKIAYYDEKIKEISEKLEALQANPNANIADTQDLKARLANAQARGFKTAEHLRAIQGAYKRIFESNDPEISNAYHPEIAEKLEEIVSMIGQNVPLSTMSLPELDQVFQAVKIVENVVRNANKFFAEGQKQTITETAKAIDNEVLKNHQKIKERIKAVEGIKGFTFTNNLKPLTLAKMIGSDTFTALLERMIDSENTWAVDQDEAKRYYEKIASETGATSWELEARREVTLGGDKVSLSLGQIMSLYALSRRKQAVKHLTEGGFVDGEDQVFYKNHKLKVLELEVNALRPTKITANELADIGKLLTDKQVEFVRKMQSYLSTTMANKGNESSRAMYGIDLFGEQFYFPIKSKQSFLAEEKRNADGKNRTKNLGMTKQTNPGANNPVVLSDFMNVWTKHINDMALYHSVTTVEDFSRVWNSRYAELDGGTPKTLKDTMATVCGENVSKYIDKLIDDANVGIRSQDRSLVGIEKLTSRTKKAAVYLSASVTIQQISAIERAKAYIPDRYFLKSIFAQFKEGHAASWEEMKRYCPVAIIKEMGGYDLTGANTRQWIMGAKGTVAKIDDKLGSLPAKMDELAWCAIWEAGKNMTASLRGENGEVLYEKGSEAFYKKASEIVTEAIRHTQVYDSIFVRSAHMRNDSQYAKALTAFMAEPTTSFNMYIEAMIDFNRGGEITTSGRKVKAKIFALQLAAGVVRASIGAALAAALIHAIRDDDEEKTFAEKYAGHAAVDIIDNLTVFNMIPAVKDYFSITQGYGIARPDVQLFEDAWRAYNALDSDELSAGEKIVDVAATISSFTPIPLKNLKRDVVGLYNTLFNSVPLSETTWLGVKEAVSEEVSRKEVLNSDLLYEAMLGGNKKEIGRIKARYDAESEIRSAIRKGLRENDPRIREAATLNINGDMKGYAEIVNEIASEKVFDKNRIIEAINLEINAINRKSNVTDNEPIDEDETVTSLFNASMLNRALDGGDFETALEMIDDMVNAKVESGKTEKETKSSIKSNVTRYWKEKYIAAWKAGNDEEMLRIRKLLAETKLYGSAYNVSSTVSSWLKDSVK